MACFIWFAAFVFVVSVLAYQRASLTIWTIALGLFFIFITRFHGLSFSIVIGWALYLACLIPLNIPHYRQRYLIAPLLVFYRKVMPTMSRTEREAISAGTITWEGDLFRGNPDWYKLLALPPASLSAEEQAFIDSPVETLARMIDDWQITHELADLPKEVWDYLKEQGFFGLIIPKAYGGKQFSAYAHSQILIKISGRSITAVSTLAVPNSLGPAELLLHYGTDEQKNYYLPRLARGEEIPCFALTSPEAGSDASSMSDHGIVCWGEFDGKKTLGIKLTFDKRYITLAPVATVIGLAFKLYDPEHLLGKKEDIGITCALIPRSTPGLKIGRRHFPLDNPFQNGPVRGDGMFIPIDWIIGGPDKAGKGWKMLMECLAVGRAISLPSNTTGGAKLLAYAAGAYARIRRQFNQPIGKFEGIEEPLARIGAYTYIMDAARTFAVATIDAGEKPAVASAIAKYHVTELGRKVGLDGMDIHGGKGICLGPNNYLGRGYEGMPIAITVEGANILTRSMIIFGQGAIRCHPYVLAELEAANLTDDAQAIKAFDKAIMGHTGFIVSNVFRSLIMGLTSSCLVKAPRGKMKRYYQQATRFSSAFALLSDTCMAFYGSDLKRKESVSARLGDILSYLYLLSAVLKHYHDQGEHVDDLPIVKYASLYCLFEIQERFDEILKNFPNRVIAWILKVMIFPLGERFSRPRDKMNRQIAKLLMAPTETRQRLAAGIYLAPVNENRMADVQDALLKTIEAEPVEKLIRTAKKEGKLSGYTSLEQAASARDNQVITPDQYNALILAHAARMRVIAVDDFDPKDLV